MRRGVPESADADGAVDGEPRRLVAGFAPTSLQQVRHEVAREDQVRREIPDPVACEAGNDEAVDPTQRVDDRDDRGMVERPHAAVHRLERIREVGRREGIALERVGAGTRVAGPVAPLDRLRTGDRQGDQQEDGKRAFHPSEPSRIGIGNGAQPTGKRPSKPSTAVDGNTVV